MGDSHIIWAVILLAIALVLFFVEFLIPSAGMIAMAALACAVAGVFFLFKVDTTVGMVGAIVCVGAVPFLFALAMKVMPNTPIFKMLSLGLQQRASLGEHGIAGGDAQAISLELTGKVGRTLTDLRPVGTCLIEGKRVDCMAASGIIKAGKPVRVIGADGLQIKVTEEEG